MAIKYVYQHCPLQDPPKFTQTGILGLKMCHLATLFQSPDLQRPAGHHHRVAADGELHPVHEVERLRGVLQIAATPLVTDAGFSFYFLLSFLSPYLSRFQYSKNRDT
jgi:hypothetical protein